MPDANGALSRAFDETTNSFRVQGTVGGATTTVDTELPAAAPLADNVANPTTVMVGACLEGINAGTWYRIAAYNTTVDDVTGGIGINAVASLYTWTGNDWDRVRTPIVFKPLDAVSVNAEATIWDPANGKKFRLMGYQLSCSAAGNVVIKDGNGGTTIAVVPSAAGGPGVSVDLGNGILSAAADNNLRAIGPAASTLSGLVWGTEE